jgi:hypothetical protein
MPATKIIPTDDDSYYNLDKDDEKAAELGDVNRRRIRQLKGFIKSTLFNRKNDDMSPEEIKKLDKHLTQHEAEVCSLILEISIQYIPEKQKYNPLVFSCLL